MYMKKILLFKLLTFIFVFLLMSVPVFANIDALNNLSKIVIEKNEDDDYKLNLIFYSKYQGNAFIQKKSDGEYFIFLPDTNVNLKKTKIIYQNNSDKSLLKVKIDEKPYVTEAKNSKYVRLDVSAPIGTNLKVASATAKDVKQGIWAAIVDFCKIIFYIAVAGFAFVICFLFISSKIFTKNTSRREHAIYSHYEKSNFNSTMLNSDYSGITNSVNKIKNSVKNSYEDEFGCFDIANDKQNNPKTNNFSSELNKSSVLLLNQKLKSQILHTNPIRKKEEENSVLDIPVVESPNKLEYKKPELISRLNISQSVGFYLTNVGETMALFGFVNENVFLFKKFNDLSQINLQARFYDKHGENDLYVVKLDSYKAMIEISSNSMKELAVL